MERMTQKAIKGFINSGLAVDITHHGTEEYSELLAKEKCFSSIGYSAGVYGLNGLLLKGYSTGTLYAITARTLAIFIYG